MCNSFGAFVIVADDRNVYENFKLTIPILMTGFAMNSLTLIMNNCSNAHAYAYVYV